MNLYFTENLLRFKLRKNVTLDDKNVPKYITSNKRKGKVLPKISSQNDEENWYLIQKKGNELNLVYQKKKVYKNKQFHLNQRIEIPKKEHFPLNVIPRARRNLIISELSRHVYFLKSKVYQPWSAITLKQKPHYWVIELHGYVEVLSCMKSDNSVIRFCCTVIADHGWYTFDLSNRN